MRTLQVYFKGVLKGSNLVSAINSEHIGVRSVRAMDALHEVCSTPYYNAST